MTRVHYIIHMGERRCVGVGLTETNIFDLMMMMGDEHSEREMTNDHLAF